MALKYEIKDSFDRRRVAEYMNQLGMGHAGERLIDCDIPGSGWVGYCGKGHIKFHEFTCEQRICPRCAGARSKQLSEKLTPALYKLLYETPAEWGYKHITLGTDINILDFIKFDKHGAIKVNRLYALREQVKLWRGFCADMMKSLMLLNPDEKGRGDVLGFGIGIEFGFDGGLLHFHVLALARFLPQFELSNTWERFNLHRGRYTYIKAVERDFDAVAKSVGYLSKYVTKPLGKKKREGNEGLVDTANTLRMKEFILAVGVEPIIAALAYVFSGVRRFQTYGAFYALEFEDLPLCACPVCGDPLNWISIGDYKSRPPSDWLKSLNTNKLYPVGVAPPVYDSQMILF